MYVYVWAFEFVCTLCMQEPMEVRRGQQNLWDQNYRWLWATLGVLGTKARSPVRTARILNHWVIARPLKLPLSHCPPYVYVCECMFAGMHMCQRTVLVVGSCSCPALCDRVPMLLVYTCVGVKGHPQLCVLASCLVGQSARVACCCTLQVSRPKRFQGFSCQFPIVLCKCWDYRCEPWHLTLLWVLRTWTQVFTLAQTAFLRPN